MFPSRPYHLLAAALLCCGIAACADTPGEISRDSEPFDGISEDAFISVGGTEPFWALNIKRAADGYEALYSTPDLPDGKAFLVKRFAGNNGLGFSGEMEGVPVNLTLTPGDCSDGMSEASYPYTATVLMGEETLFGCAHTSDQPYILNETG